MNHDSPTGFPAGSALRALLALVLIALAGGCSASSFDLVSEVEETEASSDAPTLDPILVKLRSDRRPLEQHGHRKYLGMSYLPASRMAEPTSVALLRVLVRDLVASGVARAASLLEKEQRYVLEVDIVNLYGAFGEGLENLTIILPTSGIEGLCTMRLRLRDRDGRRFLDQVFEGRAEGAASLLVGLEESATRRLAEAIRKAVDAALPVLGSSVRDFWREQGRPQPEIRAHL